MRHVVGFGLAATFLLLAGVQISFHGILSGRQQERADGAQAKKTVQDASELMRKASAMMEEAEQRSAQADRVSSELKKLQEKLAQKEEELRAQGMKAANSDANMDDGSSGGEKEGKAEVQPEKDVAGKESVHNASALFDPATMISSVPLEDALHLHRTKLDEKIEDNCHDNPDYQSSRHFVPFEGPGKGGWMIPPGEDTAGGIGACDPTGLAATAAERDGCQAFMKDNRNWARLRPISSVLNTGRTIKFLVESRVEGVHFVIKIPQRKFTHEPAGEVAAHAVDNVLGLQRVPPTTLVPLPLDWLRAAAAVFMPAMYNQWVDCFVFREDSLKKAIGKWGGGPEAVLVSAQLYVHGVHRVADSPLNFLVEMGDSNAIFDPSKPKHVPKSKLEAWGLREAADMYIFDEITGATDRGSSFASKHNTFAIGTCEAPWTCDPDTTPGKLPHTIYLDQGGCFTVWQDKLGQHKRSHFQESRQADICMFSRHLFEAVTQTDAVKFNGAVRAAMPDDTWTLLRKEHFKAAVGRLVEMSKWMQRCYESHGDGVFRYDDASSKHFVNFEAPSMGGWSPPSSVDKGRGSCDPTNFSPTAEERGACDAFMRDFRNWARVRPMTSRLNTGRTIKFQVETVDPDVHLVMKIPQKKFTLEPQSEVVAFLLDKELGLGRIPSVALVPVPVDWLRAAAAVFMPAMYNQWLDCYVLNHEAIQGMVRKGDGTTTTLQVSVQVFMKGVRPVHKTPLKLLTKLGMKLDERLDPASFEPESKLEAWAFAEACDQYVFDHLTANTDRGESFANMHNVFAAGDCETPPWGCDGKSGTEFPRLVWLDQGSAFYKASRHGVATSHFKKESKICRFSARMHKILSETNASHLEDAVLRQLPEGFFAVGISEDSVQSAFKRFSRLQSHFKHCAEHFKPEQLVVGPELLNP